MGRATVSCCPLCFRAQALRVLVKICLLGRICLFEHLSVRAVSFTSADVIFFKQFQLYSNVLSFSQLNCVREDHRQTMCALVVHEASWWSAPNQMAWTFKALTIDCNLELISEVLMNCDLMDTIYLFHAFKNGKPPCII